MAAQSKLRVYYNSACPVCKAGIESQQGKETSCEIQWNDVHARNALTEEINAELEIVRERLHVVDERGELQIGFDAFLTIWRNSPSEKWKAQMLGMPVIRQFGRLAYNVFAAFLYRWNKARRHW